MKNNDGRDNELDQLLKPLKSASPNELQMQKWKSAVQVNTRKTVRIYSTSRAKWAFQLAAAMFVGIIIGVVAVKRNNLPVSKKVIAQISLDDATFERSHDNLD